MSIDQHNESNNAADAELLVLRSIFGDELQEERKQNQLKLIFKIKPDSSSRNSTVARRCCALQLEIDLHENYPKQNAEIHLKNPRGLADNKLKDLSAQITSFIDENTASPVLYDIIQMAQDFLNRDDVTVPDLPCLICLERFDSEATVFITDQCHHHFHTWCMGRYVEHFLREQQQLSDIVSLSAAIKETGNQEMPCPLCREPVLSFNADTLILNASLHDAENSPTRSTLLPFESNAIDEYRKTYNAKFKSIYEKQKQQGGLIDLEQEQRRMLITDDTKVYISGDSTSLCRPSTSGMQAAPKNINNFWPSAAKINRPPFRRPATGKKDSRKNGRYHGYFDVNLSRQDKASISNDINQHDKF